MDEKTSEAKTKELLVKILEGNGWGWAARYIDMFWPCDMNPSYRGKHSKASEKFYKKCVEEGHRWEWYFEFSEDAKF